MKTSILIENFQSSNDFERFVYDAFKSFATEQITLKDGTPCVIVQIAHEHAFAQAVLKLPGFAEFDVISNRVAVLDRSLRARDFELWLRIKPENRPV